MPDILIRGMEMPTGCASCDFAIYKADSAYHYCFWLKQVFAKPDARLKSCPLHELPPHGDLIDMDKIQYTELYGGIEVTTANWIDSLPVVVPAERREG